MTNDYYKDYAARKRKEATRSTRWGGWGHDTWAAMPVAKRIVAICLLAGLLAMGGCGVVVMTGALDSPPTAQECQQERDEDEAQEGVLGWDAENTRIAFEACRRELWEAEGIEPEAGYPALGR